jgi:glycosyltransferase involved in cell wall biosynthesis
LNILFVHQLFPSQFKHLAPALAARGHNVLALTMRTERDRDWGGVRVVQYSIQRESSKDIHPWVVDHESKIIRSEYCLREAMALKSAGFEPDIIVAHPGWGESLFLKNIWPQARLGLYCEYYYRTVNSDFDYDPEFPHSNIDEECRVQLKNSIQLLQFEQADCAISPTLFQKQTYPDWFQPRISVIHEGIDTNSLKPDPDASITLNNNLVLRKSDNVVTFVNRTLEPYRGYHSFMRAIPAVLRSNPETYILIVGGTGKGYGASPPSSSWMDIFYAEVRDQNQDIDWDRVFFLGNLDYEIYKSVIQLATVHVYLTYPFVVSWSLLEAMSVGAAIVASDTAPVREFIEADSNGLVADFFDYEEIAAKISSLINDPALRKRLGDSARETIRNHYDLNTASLPNQLAWIENLAN